MKLHNSPTYNIKKFTTSSKQKTPPVAFGAERLFPIKLLQQRADGGFRQLDGFFSRLNYEDVGFIKKISPAWKENAYGNYILQQFLHTAPYEKFNPNKFINQFMIECSSITSPKNKVRALANVLENERGLILDLIVSKRALERDDNNILGGGTMLLYGLSKYAQKFKFENIELLATTDSKNWYQKLGFVTVDKNSLKMVLPSKKFDKFQNEIEKKWMK